MATITLTSGTTLTVPSDWNSGVNTIECYAGGGGGSGCGAATGVLDGGGAGGGGAYAKISNFAASSGAVINISIGAKGIHTNFTGGNSAAATDGGDTWLNTTATVLAKGGKGGGAAGGGSPGLGGLGGTTAASVGTTKHAGGKGGDGAASNVGAGNSGAPGFGGGAGGPTSDGGIGSSASGTTNFGSGGTSGGGSAGSGGGSGSLPAAGNNYGGGGAGGDGTTAGNGFDGAQGVIVITYTPLVAVTLTATNLTTSSPALGTPAFTQKQAFTATALTPSSPSLAIAVNGSPALTYKDSYVVLLLHCDGANGSPTFTDVSGKNHTVTRSGVAAVSTGAQKFGNGSASFDASANCYLGLDGNADFAFGTGDFTIDFWINLPAIGTTAIIWDGRPSGAESITPTIYMTGALSKLRFYANGADRIQGTTTLSTGPWQHVALVRAAGVTSLYLNGAQEGASYADANNYVVDAACPIIGANAGGATGNARGTLGLNGSLDEIRVSKGVARWTTNFTPPTAPYYVNALAASALATSSPALATPVLGGQHALGTPTTLAPSSPTFGTPFLGAVYALTALPLTPASPYLGNAWTFQAIDSNLVLLCHCDGFDGSTSVPDTSGRNHPVSLFGTASLDVGEKRFGGASLSASLDIEGGFISLDGSNDFAFGTGDFTVDFWINPQSLPSTKNSVIYDNRDSAHPNNGRLLIDSMSVPGTNTLKVIGAAGGLFSTTSLSTGVWYHVAVVRASGFVKMYLNGTSEGGSLTDTTDYLTVPAARPVFGTDASALPSLANGFLGYVDEIRVSKGVARWTNDFSVPQAPYGYLFDPNDVATSSPVLGTPGGTNGLFANNLATSSPTFGTPAITHFFALHALDLVTGSPVLGLASPIGVLRAVNLVPQEPDVPADPVLHQHPQVLAHALDLVPEPPDLGKPARIAAPPPVYPADMDRHVRRGGDDYARALIDLLPKGQAWPREPGSTLIQALTGLARFYGYVDGRAADLLETESDPRATLELLPDWERAWGLPDPCFKETPTIGERRDMLVMIMTLLGGQSRDFFYSVAEWMGYAIFIEEYSPFMCGISRCGDTTALYDGVHPRWQIGRPEMRFYWTIRITNASLNWFRASQGQAGVDPHLRIGLFIDQDCIFRRWKPAHTDIVYSYSNLRAGHSMDGTP